MQVNMHKVVIKILQGSVATQNVLGGLTIYHQLQISYNFLCHKLLKLVDSRQSYCNENRVLFLGPPCRAQAGSRFSGPPERPDSVGR